MRYLWEVLLAAQEERIPEEKLRFIHAPHGSGYMELSLPCLNQTWLETDGQRGDVSIGVNTYYRFYDIFQGMFPPGSHRLSGAAGKPDKFEPAYAGPERYPKGHDKGRLR